MIQRWDDLTAEEQQRYLTAEELRQQLAAVTARAEAAEADAETANYYARRALLAEAQLSLVDVYGQWCRNAPKPRTFSEWLARRKQAAGEALVERYGADQWRRGNAGQEPQEFDEWQKEQA